MGSSNHILDSSHDRTNPFAIVRDDKTVMWLFQNYFGHLLNLNYDLLFVLYVLEAAAYHAITAFIIRK